MNTEQMEIIVFVNAELNAVFRAMDVGVSRVRARQSGRETQVLIQFYNGPVKSFDATDMSFYRITLEVMRRVGPGCV